MTEWVTAMETRDAYASKNIENREITGKIEKKLIACLEEEEKQKS